MSKLISSPALNHVVAVLCLLALLLLAGCRTTKTAYVQSDSVRVEVRERVVSRMDTLWFSVPAQSAQAVVRDTTSTLDTDYATSTASILADGSLYHSLANKVRRVPVEAETRVVYMDSVVYRDRAVSDTRVVGSSLWDKLKHILAGFIVGVGVGLLLALLVKPLRHLVQ